MNRIFTPIARIADACNRAGVLLAEIALLLLMLLTVYAVVGRYVFNSPSIHAMEVSVYLLLVSTWGAVGWVHKVDRHVCMEALNVKLKGGWKRVANAISQAAVLTFCAMLVWAGTVVALENLDKGNRSASLLDFPMWVPYALIPIGGVLLGVVAFMRLKSSPAQEA